MNSNTLYPAPNTLTQMEQATTAVRLWEFSFCSVHHSNFEVRNNSVGRKLVVCYSIVSSLNAGKYLAILSYLLTCHQDKHKGNYPVLVQAMNSEKLAETEFPQSNSCGCLFHLCQSIWRRVQRLGLRRAYERNINLRKCVRKLMALAYLPVLLVRANFAQLCRDNLTRLLYVDNMT
jgi:hypothetical protein